MALPKFDKETFRSAALGLGAFAMVSAVNIGLSPQAHAEDPRPAAASMASYTELGVPAPQAPTSSRPYYQYNFDESMKATHPKFSPLHLQVSEADKLVVYNYIDQSNRASAMQTQVLEQTLKALAPRSQDKELLLVNVVTTDKNNRDVYAAAFGGEYETSNQLGPDGSKLDKWMLPYGVVYGEPLQEGGSHRLFDFALLNGVKTDADLNANAEGIFGKLNVVVNAYNQKKVATLASNQPELIAGINQ